jgi:hypothetical protein
VLDHDREIGERVAAHQQYRGQLVTSKLNIMPFSWCSAMWQCAI